MNKPVVVWQRGAYRIVAVEEPADEVDPQPLLVLEERCKDALGGDSWAVVEPEGTDRVALGVLMTEIASRVEVVPSWVRDFVKRDCASIDEDSAEENKGGAA